MTVPVTSPTTVPVIAASEKRQNEHVPAEASEPMLNVLAGAAADALKERANGGDGFNSLLCATLKALKGENPTTFTSLLQSCTSLIDSESYGRKRALKERNVEALYEVVSNGPGKAKLGRSETDLLEKQSLDVTNAVDRRQDEGFNSLL